MGTTSTQGRHWLQSGNTFRQLYGGANLVPQLPVAVYEAIFDRQSGEFYLNKIDDKFTFGGKLYGLEDKFISHVLKTYNNTTQNLGILLNGSKGTGKTVCAKILANEMQLPIILCNTPLAELTSFIAQFNVPAIFFFDEFEKNFSGKTEILLSAMDGAYNTNIRKIFILTTNSLYINDNFLSRPSRIRYKKTFGNLSQEIIRNYCEENLEDMSKFDEISEFIDTLSVSTIDILKTIVEEVNLHKCGVEDFKNFFNVSTAPYQYNVVTVEATHMYSIDEFRKEVSLYMEDNNVETSSDEDDDFFDEEEEEAPPTKAKFKRKALKRNNARGNFITTRISSERSATDLREGDNFHHGTVVKPMTKDGIIVLSNTYQYGKPYTFCKVIDVEAKPSIYHNVCSIAF